MLDLRPGCACNFAIARDHCCCLAVNCCLGAGCSAIRSCVTRDCCSLSSRPVGGRSDPWTGDGNEAGCSPACSWPAPVCSAACPCVAGSCPSACWTFARSGVTTGSGCCTTSGGFSLAERSVVAGALALETDGDCSSEAAQTLSIS